MSDTTYQDHEEHDIVSGLFAIAGSLKRIAKALESIDRSLTTPEVGEALQGLSRIGY